MNAKDFISNVFSRKSSIAAIAIFALVYIATVAPGQLAIDSKAGVSIVPMSPALPAAAEHLVDWKIPAEITLIACLAIICQGVLDYFRPRGRKIEANVSNVELKPPSPESMN